MVGNTQSLVQVDYEDGIYLATFYSSSHATVNEYIRIMMGELLKHIEKYGANTPMSIVLDVTRPGMFSINYMNEKVMAVFSHFEQIPDMYIAYLADRTHDKLVASLVNSITAGKFKNSRRVFNSNQKPQAIQWLKSLRAGV